MQGFSAQDLAYVIRVDEIAWGGLLLALTIAVHGTGMFNILRMTILLADRTAPTRQRFPVLGMGILILAVWIIVLVHLAEVAIWAAFFVWKEAQPNIFSAFYSALLNYTALQAGYLPIRWRLLEGMLGIAGLLSFAWSTGTLLAVAAKFIQEPSQSSRKK